MVEAAKGSVVVFLWVHWSTCLQRINRWQCLKALLHQRLVAGAACTSHSNGIHKQRDQKWEKGRCHKKAKEKEKEHSKVGSKQCVGTCLALFEAGASVELYVACCSLMLIFFVCSVTLTCFSCGIFGMHLMSRYAIPQPQAKGVHRTSHCPAGGRHCRTSDLPSN